MLKTSLNCQKRGKRLLGHRSVLPTQIYINMEQAIFSGSANEYHVKAVSSIEEATALLQEVLNTSQK
jgi:hypothetical protein